MPALRKTVLFTLLALAAFSGARAEDSVKFKDLPYPIEAGAAEGRKEGAVLFETPYSVPSAAEYDTVLVQGEMPLPSVRVVLVVKPEPAAAPETALSAAAFRRFPNGRFWAKFRVPLTRRPLKFRVLSLGARAAAAVSLYEAETFVRSLAKEAPVPPAAPYVPDPALFLPETAPFKVIRRGAWQALPPTEPYTPHLPSYFTLHHTQGNYPATYEAAVSEVQFVQDYHQHAKEWIDIAYHFLIDPAGNIFEGRPLLTEGAHVLKRNPGNIGISFLGNYHPPASNAVTPASAAAFVAVGRYLKDTYAVNVSSFYAHRDIGNTDCPGDILYAKKPELSALIFNPQPRPLSVDLADAPPLTPAQQKALRQLQTYLGK